MKEYPLTWQRPDDRDHFSQLQVLLSQTLHQKRIKKCDFTNI